MAKVICQNCGSEVILPEKSSFAMGMTISEETEGTYELPMKRVEKENKIMMNANNNTNATVNNTNNNGGMNMNGMNFDMDKLAQMVAQVMQSNMNQGVTENVDTNNTNVSVENKCYPTVNGGKWAKSSEYYGKEICGFVFNPYMMRWHLQKRFEELMNAYRNNIHRAIVKEIPYMKSIKDTLEEVRKLAMLEKEDRLAFDERRHCFDLQSCKRIFIKYYQDVIKQIEENERELIATNKVGKTVYIGLKKYGWIEAGIISERIVKHKVVKYLARSIEFESVFVDLNRMIQSLKGYGVWSYKELYKLVNGNIAIKVSADTPKSKDFLNCYIKAGAYYTAKQTLMFKKGTSFRGLSGRDAVLELRSELNKEYTEGYMIYAMLKKIKGIY